MWFWQLGLIPLLLLIHPAWSSISSTDNQSLRNLPVFNRIEHPKTFYTQQTQPLPLNTLSTDQYIGDVDTVGWTWWTYQLKCEIWDFRNKKREVQR